MRCFKPAIHGDQVSDFCLVGFCLVGFGLGGGGQQG
jgi:hypothetical protein